MFSGILTKDNDTLINFCETVKIHSFIGSLAILNLCWKKLYFCFCRSQMNLFPVVAQEFYSFPPWICASWMYLLAKKTYWWNVPFIWVYIDRFRFPGLRAILKGENLIVFLHFWSLLFYLLIRLLQVSGTIYPQIWGNIRRNNGWKTWNSFHQSLLLFFCEKRVINMILLS